jgi:hypothetical protein
MAACRGADAVLHLGGIATNAPRMLSTWLSPGDFCRLVDAALGSAATGYTPVWGVSANTRRWWSTRGGDALGYTPLDDAEAYAAALDTPQPPPAPHGPGAPQPPHPWRAPGAPHPRPRRGPEAETVGGSRPAAQP